MGHPPLPTEANPRWQLIDMYPADQIVPQDAGSFADPDGGESAR